MANTITKGRIAPKSLPSSGNTDPIHAFADAHNALAMALHYLTRPEPMNVPGAKRKAVQALAALRRLGAEVPNVQ